MSVSEITARITQIQSQLALLAPRTGASTAAGFASSLATATAAASGTGAAGTAPTGTSADGQQVVAEARKYLGIPYVWGGTDPDKGLDCSGLVQLVYKNLGVDLPRVSYQQAEAGRVVQGGLDNAQPGDILAFGSPVHHVGIYIGDGQMIEAPRTGLDVRVIDVYETPSHIRRVLPDAAATSSGGLPGIPALDGIAGIPAASRVPADVPYRDLFVGASQRYGVDAGLLAAVARQESGYDPQAVSPAGAQGLMQLMPGTARGLGVTDSFDPVQAVDGAARLLRDLLDRFGSTDLALAGYNAGPGAVLRYDGVPPYPETQNYVRSVLAMIGPS
ncbi:transglycosylase SLT domain-containing protein [Nocardioides dongkuii]|uniref:transglycosylase SLT domain-containing protein n=1 Tax=Nocardioides dongkuii TaxID=2760089 RepID=UPI0015F95986|nr:transglycosylase SLT domain-containing protein [Nocardioides dongkuii]